MTYLKHSSCHFITGYTGLVLITRSSANFRALEIKYGMDVLVRVKHTVVDSRKRNRKSPNVCPRPRASVRVCVACVCRLGCNSPLHHNKVKFATPANRSLKSNSMQSVEAGKKGLWVALKVQIVLL